MHLERPEQIFALASASLPARQATPARMSRVAIQASARRAFVLSALAAGALALAFVPYLLLRGPVERIARWRQAHAPPQSTR